MIRKILVIFIAVITTIAVEETEANNPLPRTAAQKRTDITVRQTAPITFGTFAATGNGGTILIDAGSGARTLTGNISALSGGDYGQAEFILSGQPNAEIMITPPASSRLNNAGTKGDLVITDFKINPSAIVTLDRQGIVKVRIGGVLKVPGNIPQGAYNGFFNVTARYMR